MHHSTQFLLYEIRVVLWILPGLQGQCRPGLLHLEIRAICSLGHSPGIHGQAGAIRADPDADGHGRHRDGVLLVRGHQDGQEGGPLVQGAGNGVGGDGTGEAAQARRSAGGSDIKVVNFYDSVLNRHYMALLSIRTKCTCSSTTCIMLSNFLL